MKKSNRINSYNETRKDLDKNMTEEANKSWITCPTCLKEDLS